MGEMLGVVVRTVQVLQGTVPWIQKTGGDWIMLRLFGACGLWLAIQYGLLWLLLAYVWTWSAGAWVLYFGGGALAFGLTTFGLVAWVHERDRVYRPDALLVNVDYWRTRLAGNLLTVHVWLHNISMQAQRVQCVEMPAVQFGQQGPHLQATPNNELHVLQPNERRRLEFHVTVPPNVPDAILYWSGVVKASGPLGNWNSEPITAQRVLVDQVQAQISEQPIPSTPAEPPAQAKNGKKKRK